jgi:inosine/xanthosine triphosphate pyrophosphatase family protein
VLEQDGDDRVKNKKVLKKVKEERNFLHTVKQRNANWIGYILHMNFLLKRVFEGKIKGRVEVVGRRRMCKQSVGDV